MKYKHAKILFMFFIGFFFGVFFRLIDIKDIEFWQVILLWLWVFIPTSIAFYLAEKHSGINREDIIK